MTASNLPRSLELIFGAEGGFSDDPRDPGNWTGGARGKGKLLGTKFGIAANSYPHIDIRHLTIQGATDIYHRDYASKINFDRLPLGVDYATLDYAINSGPHKAAMDLQNVVDVADDGQIGDITIRAVLSRNPISVLADLCDRRLRFLQRLSGWHTYHNGWTARVATVKAEGTKMASGK